MHGKLISSGNISGLSIRSNLRAGGCDGNQRNRDNCKNSCIDVYYNDNYVDRDKNMEVCKSGCDSNYPYIYSPSCGKKSLG